MTTIAALLALAYVAGWMFTILGAATLVLGPEPVIKLDTVKPYEPLMRVYGGELQPRPEGLQALKAEIAHTPEDRPELVLVPAPPVKLRTRKRRPDWDFNTDHHRQVVANWFEGMPDDLAVQRVAHVGA
jgi:hypothetical protein